MLYINSMGHFFPENLIDNQFLEDLDIGTNNEWIVERVGIRNRRTVMSLDYLKNTKNTDPSLSGKNSDYSNAQSGAHAAKMARIKLGLRQKISVW